MSRPAPTLLDPQLEAFYAADPAHQLEQATAGAAAATPVHPRLPRHILELGVAIAAAFLVVRRMVAVDLSAAPAPDDVSGAAAMQWRRYAPLWLRLVVPALTHAYALGQTSGLTDAELQGLATRYASDLGDYLNDTSAQALVDGFNAQLSQRWSERVAWQRAGMAYGLDRQQMLAHVNGLMKASDTGGQDLVSDAARALVDKAVLARADTIGQSESWRFLQVGKAIAWLTRQQAGELSAEAVKEWDTARGETPCTICGPLDGVQVPLADSWNSAAGALFAPGAHPNCRCQIRLREPAERAELIHKTLPGDPYDRNRLGEFARREQRRPAAKTAERDPQIEEILRQVREISDEPAAITDPFARSADPFARSASADPFARAGDPFARSADPMSRAARSEQGSVTEQRRGLAALRRQPRPGSRRVHSAGRIQRVILLPPLPVRDTARHDSYYLPVSELNAMLHAQNKGGEFFDYLDEPAFHRNDLVDFGRHIAEATSFWEHRDPDPPRVPDRPQPFVAVATGDFTHLVDDHDEDLDAFFADRRQLVKAVRGEALNNVDSVLPQLSRASIANVYYLYGQGSAHTDPVEALAAIREAVVRDPDHPLAAAFADHVAYCEPGVAGSNGEDLERELRDSFGSLPDTPHVPELFVFDQGFAPGDGEHGHGNLVDIKGKYLVDQIGYVSGTQVRDEKEGLAGFRLLYLKPAE